MEEDNTVRNDETTRWKESEPLNDLMDQSYLTTLDLTTYSWTVT